MSAPRTTVTPAQAEAAVKKHGSKTAAAAALGIHRETVRKLLTGRNSPSKRSTGGVPTGRRTLQAFRDQFDRDTIVPRKLRACLADVADSGDVWIPECELRERAHVSAATLNQYRDEFVDLIIEVDHKRIWAVNKTVADKLRSVKLL